MYAAYALPQSAVPRPYPYRNPQRNPSLWWGVGAILLVGAGVTAATYYLVKRTSPAEAQPPTPVPEGEPPPPPLPDEGAGEPPEPEPTPRDAARLLFEENRDSLMRAIYEQLDVLAAARGFQGGWVRATDLGPALTAPGIPPTRPDVGSPAWNDAAVWLVATLSIESALPGVPSYPDEADWAATVSADGDPYAWLKGVVVREIRRLVQLPMESDVAGQTVNWLVF